MQPKNLIHRREACRRLVRGGLAATGFMTDIQDVVGANHLILPETGVIRVTQGKADLAIPPEGEGFRYGIGYPFQVAPGKAGLFCNLRTEGLPVGDFEAGVDVVLFDCLSDISSTKPIQLTRNKKFLNEKGERRILIKYPLNGGFVPFGARLPNRRPHPHAGTGFVIGEVLDFPMNEDGSYSKSDKTGSMVRKIEVMNLAYDGHNFRVVKTELRTAARPLKPPDSGWAISAPSMRMAIPDNNDLLVGMVATKGDVSKYYSEPTAAGVSRWRCLDGLWQLVSFVPVAFNKMPERPQVVHGQKMSLAAAEPTLIRDTDGSLLFSVRSAYSEVEDHIIRVWRSADGGATWKLIVEVPNVRGQAPVTLNQAADGTPYIVSNLLGHERDWLVLWPLKQGRSGLETPITVRNALKEFGSPPSAKVWFVDHPNATTVQLADKQWHNLLAYRIMDRGEHEGRTPAAQTGLYVEEVISIGSPVPAWDFE